MSFVAAALQALPISYTVYARFLWTLKKTQVFTKKLRFLSILVKIQVKNRIFQVTYNASRKTQVQQQKTQGLDQLLINEYSLGRPKKKPGLEEEEDMEGEIWGRE